MLKTDNARLFSSTSTSKPRKRWQGRSALLLSLILAGALTLIYQQWLASEFNRDRIRSFQQDRLLLQTLLDEEKQRLTQLARLSPQMQPWLGISNTAPDLNLWRSLLSTGEPAAYVGIYSRSRQQIQSSWTPPDRNTQPSERMLQWLNNTAAQQQRTASRIECRANQCLNYLLVTPTLPESADLALLAAFTLDRLLQRFAAMRGYGIALLASAKQSDPRTQHLPNLGLNLILQTGQPQQADLRTLLNSLQSLPGQADPRIQRKSQDHWYEIGFHSVPYSPSHYLAVVAPLNRGMPTSPEQLAVFFLWSLVILLPALLLWNLALSYRGNHEAEQRLENFQQTQYKTNRKMQQQLSLLEKDRDHLKKMVDNIQSIILTLDHKARILTVNGFGLLITGQTEQQLVGQCFTNLCVEQEPLYQEDLEKLRAIGRGEQQTYRHEIPIRGMDGSTRTILWLHTRLDDTVLSTGLDVTDSRSLETRLSWLADHDSLTALYNRRRLEQELDDALAWSSPNTRYGVLLFIDLDNFKDLNDSCGHQVGDTILRKVASTLTSITRVMEPSTRLICARLGGDEFAVLLRNMDAGGGSVLSGRILDALQQIRHEEEGVHYQLSCSIGIATFPAQENSRHEILSNADYAMYQAKLSGRNQYYRFRSDDSRREKLQQRMLWKDKIEYALSNETFVLHFQPIMDVRMRTISHYETLIRMQDGDQLVYPGSFINVAERLGLIVDIDHFILDHAIKKQADLFRQGHEVTLAINLSGKAFDDPDLGRIIEQKILQHGARPENLIFEITETAAVSDIIAAEKIMLDIQSLGCQFALDDFGVGFSSFYYLRELPVELVKIDGSFVKDLPNNADNQVLVNALSEVAIGFNKLSVAEFVDSLETLRLLHKARINYAQGFFIGKPSAQIPVEPPQFFSLEHQAL